MNTNMKDITMFTTMLVTQLSVATRAAPSAMKLMTKNRRYWLGGLYLR